MPADREPNADAYRTLGLEPGASRAEVKRAYRLLAKAFHPDSAGEAALPRFLAIHDAYDQLITGRAPSTPRSTRATGAAAEPWHADPARARQARERAKAGGASAGRAGAGPRGSTGTSGGTGPTGAAGRAGTGGSGTRASGRRATRKATMGSTSYDEARDANDPTWSGASWYGPSSGEYWIVNPREFADPRKHGPAYLSRARRPLPGDSRRADLGEPADDEIADDAGSAKGFAGEGVAAAGRASAASSRPRGHAASAAWTTTTSEPAQREEAGRWGSSPSASSWTAPIDDRDRPGDRPTDEARRVDVPPPPSYVGGRPDADATEASGVSAAIGGIGRSLLGRSTDDPIRRLGLALLAWAPIGLAAAAIIGAVTGCASYSATCDGAEPILPWLAQAAILGLLLLVPELTRILAGGALAVLVALVPTGVVLAVIGGTKAPQDGLAVAVLLGIPWIAGVIWAVRETRRLAREGRPT